MYSIDVNKVKQLVNNWGADFDRNAWMLLADLGLDVEVNDDGSVDVYNVATGSVIA